MKYEVIENCHTACGGCGLVAGSGAA
jgi:hypothetical protein